MLTLEDPISKVPLIGPKYEKLLSKLEIYTIKDLLYHFPFRYEDFSIIKKIKDLETGEIVTVFGRVAEIKNVFTKYGKRLTKLKLVDETGELRVVWFNQPYLIKSVDTYTKLAISGQLSTFDNKPAFISPEYEILQITESGTTPTIHTGRLVPIYPETYGISSKWLRTKINFLLRNLEIEEFLPEQIIKEHNFPTLKDAFIKIHFPENPAEVEEAKKRFAFEETFEFILKSEIRKASRKKLKAAKKLDPFPEKIYALIKRLPFELTNSQKNAIAEITQDLTYVAPMNRLLQGDVGSGKTVVALIVAYIAYLNGVKTYFMAPTEILANQHYETFKKYLKPLGIEISLTTGSKKEDKEAYINIGTHALIYAQENNKKKTKKLKEEALEEKAETGLVIIDEQHRFGVEQRSALVKPYKGTAPHLLSMTATPIPRTLALTIYGDLDISSLTEMPKERKKVTTWVVPNYKRENAYGWIKEQITSSKGKNQAFIICPLIEESEHETMQNVKAATKEFEQLSKTVFKDFKTELLHGKLKAKEKDEIITNFRNGKLNILIATPVIEVGIDISTATMVVIEASERFGLASLHQIRGRVGRGSENSYCMLFTTSKNPQTIERLKLLETSHNGLELSEMDLKLRGEGEITGVRQHGSVKFKLTDLTDTNLIKDAKENVIKIFPEIKNYPKLLERIKYLSIVSAN